MSSRATLERRKGSYGSPHGSDTRDPRAMIAPLMQFSIDTEIDSLRLEEEYRTGDRNSRTLTKATDLRLLLTVLRASAALDEQDGVARTSVQLIDGTATVSIEGAGTLLQPGDLAVVDRGQPWLLTAETDCAVLVTVCFPPEKAGV